MGCGCDKRAKKLLAFADKKRIPIPAPARKFLQAKARSARLREIIPARKVLP